MSCLGCADLKSCKWNAFFRLFLSVDGEQSSLQSADTLDNIILHYKVTTWNVSATSPKESNHLEGYWSKTREHSVLSRFNEIVSVAWPVMMLAGLGAPLSSSLLKRRYISLQNEWMNEWMILLNISIVHFTSTLADGAGWVFFRSEAWSLVLLL